MHKDYALTDLLIVGHTDTRATYDHNLTLSLERTSAMRAFLKDDADSWLLWYGDNKPQSKRWGNTEDNHMIQSLLSDPGCKPASDGNPYPQTVLGYQQWHNAAAPKKSGYDTLKEDGKIGSGTRKASPTLGTNR